MHRRSSVVAGPTLLLSLLLSLFAADVATAQDDQSLKAELLRRMQKMESEIATLRKQVDDLTSALGAGGRSAPAPAATDPERVMQVMRIEPVTPEESQRPEVEKLRAEADVSFPPAALPVELALAPLLLDLLQLGLEHGEKSMPSRTPSGEGASTLAWR